jgi:hypothetical protein
MTGINLLITMNVVLLESLKLVKAKANNEIIILGEYQILLEHDSEFLPDAFVSN